MELIREVQLKIEEQIELFTRLMKQFYDEMKVEVHTDDLIVTFLQQHQKEASFQVTKYRDQRVQGAPVIPTLQPLQMDEIVSGDQQVSNPPIEKERKVEIVENQPYWKCFSLY